MTGKSEIIFGPEVDIREAAFPVQTKITEGL